MLKPPRVHTIVISTQLDGDYAQEQLKKDLMEHVIKPVVPAQSIYHLYPPGSFVIDTATGSEVRCAGSF